MPDVVCLEAMHLLNAIFTTPLILNDGHEVLAQLEEGDDLATIVEGLGKKFSTPEQAAQARGVVEAWPALHLEAVGEMVRWALGKLDTDDRVTIRWRGNAEHPETVTKFELRDHNLLVEFAHPPISRG